MSRTGAYRDDLPRFLRDHDQRIKRLENRRRLIGTGGNGGGGGDHHHDEVYVNVDGDTMTGPLLVPGPPLGPAEAANKAYVDLMDEVIISTTNPGTGNTWELWYDPDASVAPAGLGFTFVQGVAATVWTIDHPLTFQPNVTVMDSSGQQVEGDVSYVDADTITITFSAAFSGTALLS